MSLMLASARPIRRHRFGFGLLASAVIAAAVVYGVVLNGWL
jgi:hypothetical protein